MWTQATRFFDVVIRSAVIAITLWGALGSFDTYAADAKTKEKPVNAVVQHPWVVPSPHSKEEAYFTNLDDGANIETPFRLTFGLSGGWGLAPVSSAVSGKSGHHHLLVNRDLPLDFKKALPFNNQYIHFGNGQMETMLNLAPGPYTLRLLLADNGHIPRFVYSKPIQINVTKMNKVLGSAEKPKPSISFLNETPNAVVKRPFKLQFHASGLNVAHLEQHAKGTGHFRLSVTSSKDNKTEVLSFSNGQTEVWLAPPAGAYRMKLEFMDNLQPHKSLVEAVNLPMQVE